MDKSFGGAVGGIDEVDIGGWTARRVDGENGEGVLKDVGDGVWGGFAEEDEVAGVEDVWGVGVDVYFG